MGQPDLYPFVLAAAVRHTIKPVLPGRFDTDRLRSGRAFAAQKSGRPVAEVEAKSRAQILRRFGAAEEFG